MKRLLALLALVPGLAFAQGATRQNGPMVQFDIAGFVGDRTLETGSKILTDYSRGFNPFAVTDTNGLGITFYSALTSGTYNTLSFGHDSGGNPIFNVNGTNYPFLGVGSGNVIGPGSVGSGSIACYNGTSPTLLKDCSLINDGAITSGALPPLVATANSTSVTAATIRANVTGNVTRDVNQSVVYLASGTTTAIADANAYSAYVRSDVAGGVGANGVAYKSMSICNQVNNCSVWGGNSILSDSLVNNVITAASGILVGWEYDFGVTSPNTRVSGVNLQLQGSISQPTAADGFAVSPNIAGTIQWVNSFVSNSGATGASGSALYVGAQAISGTNVLSQLVKYAYIDGAGVGKNYRTGVSASQQFYIQTDAGTGLAQLNVDGSIVVPQAGQFVIGVDQTVASSGAGNIGLASGGTVTSVGVGRTAAALTLNGSVVKFPSLSAVGAGTGKRFLCIDTATKQIYEGSGASCI